MMGTAIEIDYTARTFDVCARRARELVRRRVGDGRYNALLATDIAGAILDVLAWFHAQNAFYYDRKMINSLLALADTREAMVLLCRAQGYRMKPASSASVAVRCTPVPVQGGAITLRSGLKVQVGDLTFELLEDTQIPAGAPVWPDGTTDDLIVFTEGVTKEVRHVSTGEKWQKFPLEHPNTIEGSVTVEVAAELWEEVPSLVFSEGDRRGRDTFVGDGTDNQEFTLSLLHAVIDPDDEDGILLLVQPSGQPSSAAVTWRQAPLASGLTGAPLEYDVVQEVDGTTKIRFGTVADGAAPAAGDVIDVHYLIVGAQKRYQLTYDQDDTAIVLFGDGIFGLIPPAGSEIVFRYRVGGGVRGNVDIGAIDTTVQGFLPSGARASVRLYNLETGSGGNPPESVDHARYFAPKFAVSGDRAVRRLDFTTHAATYFDQVYGALAHASAYLKQTVPELNTVEIATWGRDSEGNLTTSNTPLKYAVKKYLDSKRTICTNVEVVDGQVVVMDIDASVILETGAARQTVWAAIRQSIEKFFSSAFVLPGVDLSVSRLYNAIQETGGVESAEIIKVTGASRISQEIGTGDGFAVLFSGNLVLQEGTALVPQSVIIADADGGQQAVDDGEGAFTGDNDNSISPGSTGNAVDMSTGVFSLQFADPPPIGSRVYATARAEVYFAREEDLGGSDGNVGRLDGATDYYPIVQRRPQGVWSGDQVRVVDSFQIGSTQQMAGRLAAGVLQNTLTIQDSGGQVVSDNGTGALVQTSPPVGVVGSVNYQTGDVAFTWNALPTTVIRALWQTETVEVYIPDEFSPFDEGRVFLWGGFDADGLQPGGVLFAYDDGEEAIYGNVDITKTYAIRYEDGKIEFTWSVAPAPGPGAGGSYVATLSPVPDGVTRQFAFTTGQDFSRGGLDGEGRLRLQLTDLATPGVAFEDAYDNWNGDINGESLDPEGTNVIAYGGGSGTITFLTPPAAAASPTFLIWVTNVATLMYSGWVFRVKTPGAPGLDKGLFADHTGRLWGPPAAGPANTFPTDRLDHLRGRYVSSLAGSPVAAGRAMVLTYDSLTGVPPSLDIPIDGSQIASLGRVNLTEKPPEVQLG